MDHFHFGKHSSSQFNEEMESIRSHLMEMGGLVQKQMSDALLSLLQGDSPLAEQVLKVEERVDALEKRIDEECARVLALRQPAASDLRMLIAVSKCVSDLERIGDESAKIAALSIQLTQDGNAGNHYVEVRHIGEHVSRILHAALDAFARFDADRAVEIAAEDQQVDMAYRSAMRSLITFMMEDPRSISRVLNVIWILRALERIGDHSRNLCEQVVYLVKGKDVRHISPDAMKAEIHKPR